MPQDARLAEKTDRRLVGGTKTDGHPFLIFQEQCTRKDPNQVKCDRCLNLSYNCTIDDVNAPIDGKRRKLQRLKCEACRTAKVKVNY